jgi:hypothetical protein
MLVELNKIHCSPMADASSAKQDNIQFALQEELLREESLWKQKSRELWLTSKN